MINPTIEFLKEVTGKKVLVTKTFNNIKVGTKINLKDFELNENEIKFIFEYQKKEFFHIVDWKDSFPFTQFTSAKVAYFHAKRTKKRFEKEIENVVFKNSPKLLYLYALAFIKEKFNDSLEKIIVQSPYYAFKYARNFLGQRLSEDQEKIFFKDKTGECLATYALEVVKGKLPEDLHNFLILKSMEKNISNFTRSTINKYFRTYAAENIIGGTETSGNELYTYNDPYINKITGFSSYSYNNIKKYKNIKNNYKK